MSMNDPKDARRKRLAPGIAMIGIGVLTVPTSIGLVLWLTFSTAGQGTQFRAPGSTIITVNETGPYMVFHETQGTFEGTIHRNSENAIAGIRIVVTFIPDQSNVPIESYSGMSVEMPSAKRESIVRFRAEHPGEYLVSASGNTKPAVLFVSKDTFVGMIWPILGSCAVNLIGLVMIGLGVGWLVRAGTIRNRDASTGRTAFTEV